MSEPPRLFDRDLRRLRLTRAARAGPGVNFLAERAWSDIAERLATINRRFETAVAVGAAGFGPALAASDAAGKVSLLVDAGLVRLSGEGPRLVADPARLPFAETSLDLLVSALDLHWVDDLVGALIQIRRALKPDGLFIGALLGGATLTELRAALTEAELELAGGAGPRVSPFLDAYDGAGLMQRAGFALPVVDVDTVEVRYDHILALMADLRAMVETNVLIERPRRPLTRAVLERAGAIYAARFAGAGGRIAATFDIVTLTGWAPHPDQPKALKPGSAQVSLADVLARRRPAR